MKVIVGLGNPGSEYAQTRHNIGFEAADRIAGKCCIPLTKAKFNALYGKGTVDGEELIIVKPLTYMNLSGEAVSPLLNFYKIPVENLLVIYDDMDLPIGKIRLRQKGSAGGHNGVKSLIHHLHTQDFKRIKVGIGHPQKMAVVSYVLQRFSADESVLIGPAIESAAEAAVSWLTTPFQQVMNQYNSNN